MDDEAEATPSALTVLLTALAACSGGPTILPPPTDPAASTWMLILFDGDETRAHVLDDHPFRVEVDALAGVTLEAIGFPANSGLIPGPLAVSSIGKMLPSHAAAYRADLIGKSWDKQTTPSERASALRIPQADDCSMVTATAAQLEGSASVAGVRAMLELEPDWRLMIAPDAWHRANAEGHEPFPLLVTSVLAGAVGPDGKGYLATDRAIHTLEKTGSTWTSTLAWLFPEKIEAFTLVVPRAGVVYGIDDTGRLFHSEATRTVFLHAFEFGASSHDRGMIYLDGQRVIAGVGPDSTLVEVDADDRIRTFSLPTRGEGAVSVTRFGDLGLVVGTNRGTIRAQSLGFEEVPDPLDQLPRQIQIRALLPYKGRLIFAGNSGVFAELTPSGLICTSDARASNAVRFLSPLGDEILATGDTFEMEPTQVNLTRFKVTH